MHYKNEIMIAVLQKSASCVGTLFLIGLVGYWLGRRGWFSAESRALIPRLVLQVTLPPYMVYNILEGFNREDLLHLAYGCVAPAIAILATMGLAWLLTILVKPKPGRHGLFLAGVSYSNTIFIGLPVNLALFGNEALPYVLLFYFVSTGLFWTVGNYCLRRDGAGSAEVWSLKALLSVIFSPPLLGFITGVALVLMELRPPSFFMDAAQSVGSLTSPLALIYIGLTLSAMDFRRVKIDRDLVLVVLGRVGIGPALMVATLHLFDLPPLMGQVFIIQASLPVLTSLALLAGAYKLDTAYASMTTALSTLFCLFSIPFYMALITLFNL